MAIGLIQVLIFMVVYTSICGGVASFYKNYKRKQRRNRRFY